MKTFEIYMPGFPIPIGVTGEMISIIEETKQSVIYSKNDPSYSNIVAIIPANALVITSIN